MKLAIKYSRTTITPEEVMSALRSKELESKTKKQSSSNGSTMLEERVNKEMGIREAKVTTKGKTNQIQRAKLW